MSESDSDSDSAPDSVGYRKPPKHTRWKSGQSGNPKGRAKGQRNLKTDLLEELSEKVVLNQGGNQIRLTKQRAFVKALAARAIKGDSRAASLLASLMLRMLEPETEASDLAEPLSADDQGLLADFLARHSQSKGTDNE